MVLGLAALMSERSTVRSQYKFDRTTIGAQDNNPFKWAPTQRLGIDLLVNRDCGFLSGEAAIRNSFADLKKHVISTVAGFQASLRALLGSTDPDRIQRDAQRDGFLQSRDAARWNAFRQAHGAAQRQLLEDEDGPLNEAFIQAYEDRMRELDRGDLS
jgi:predicted component of type VI protein secretion system